MLLFAREIRLTGSHQREAIAHAVRLAEYVTQTNGVPVDVWSHVYSPTADTIAFTAFLPDMTGLETAMDKLIADDRYHEMVEQAQQYMVPGSLTDSLATILYPTELPAEPVRATYARSVTSTAVVSRMSDAVELGVRIAARAEEVTGSRSVFGVEETGPFVGVTWVYAYADAAEAERFNQAVIGDPTLVGLIRQTPDLFIAGGSTRTLYRKLN